ncbi:ABC transporter substrate-binding protein [Provencibacterium massiliense]|uniref:ABC transporter substrate-binding protein n=1 Tax=Provencibacterium massiliense TaxID=1841868 RepID=UPI0009A61FF6|nr:extracellular solute-binding protein [Provencibacterium massiliense]
MKRLLASLLCASMLLVSFAGCGSKEAAPSSTPETTPETPASSTEAETEPTGEGATIELWLHQNEAWNASHQTIADQYMTENPGQEIVIKTFPYSDFLSKIQTSLLSGGEGADIYEMWGGWALDFTGTGALAEVPADISATFENFYAPVLGAYTRDGKYYGVPLEFNIEYGGLLVNKKLFGEKGLEYPKTWADIEKIADATSSKDGEVMNLRGFDFVSEDNILYTFLAMILSSGGSYLTEDGKVDFTTPEAVDAMTTLVSYVRDKGYTNLDGITSGKEGYSFVYTDESMMDIVGPWAVADGSASYGLEYGTDYEYIALPPYKEPVKFAAETGWGLTVAESSDVKDAAWKYVAYFDSPEVLVKHNIACSQIPPRTEIVEMQEYKDGMPYAQPLLDILPAGQFIGPFNTTTIKENIDNIFTELCTTDNYPTIKDGLVALTDNLNTAFFG